MSIVISKALQAKAVVLDSMTIDSPTERTNKGGEAIRPTIYFTKGKLDKKLGKKRPVKGKSTLYTQNKDEAEAIDGCEHQGVETLSLDGVKTRWLKDDLEDSDIEELHNLKGMVASEAVVNMIASACKKLVGTYVMSLPLDQRQMVAEQVSSRILVATDKLTSEHVAKKAKAKISLW